tara:strand:+ start:5529 stop:5759 length:231 start_codon:yes stop_codon:yes gene_type:complete
MRLAGDLFDFDLTEGLTAGNIDSLRRGFRADKMIPRSLTRGFYDIKDIQRNEMAPENSEPEYTLTGAYQPEVTYGL